MGVSSYTKAPLVGAFFCCGSRRARVAALSRYGGNARRSAVKRRGLRPARERRRTLRGEAVGPAYDAEKPAVDIAQQNLRRIGDSGFDVGGAPGAAGQRSRASECLLAIGGHDRRLAASTGGGVAEPPPGFGEPARAAPRIAARPPGAGLDQHLHAAVRRDAGKPETPQPAEPAHAWIALPAAAAGAA